MEKKFPALRAASRAVVKSEGILRPRAGKVLASSPHRTFPKAKAQHRNTQGKGGNY
jgi:hypothetical protein